MRPAPCRSSSRRAGADLAVGCTYKYLNAGPGAPAFLYVRRELQERLRSPIQGWFGEPTSSRWGREYEPAPGIVRFLAGTPAIIGVDAVQAGAAEVAEAGIEPLRGQIDRPDRAGDRAARRAAGAARLPAGHAARRRPAAAPTSPSATPTPGASARR